jgi:hypothetical protein
VSRKIYNSLFFFALFAGHTKRLKIRELHFYASSMLIKSLFDSVNDAFNSNGGKKESQDSNQSLSTKLSKKGKDL